MGTAWDNFNGTGKIITKSAEGSKSPWDSYNATAPVQTVKPKFGEAPQYVNGHPNSPVFKDYQPSTAGTISEQKPGFLQGVDLNAPSTGLPLVTVSGEGPSFHPETSSNPLVNNQLVKQVAGAANSFLGSIFKTASSWDTVLQNAITNAPTSQKVGGLATAAMDTANTFIPAFAIANASMAASREITIPDFMPVIGGSKPFAKVQDMVFGGLSKLGDEGVSKAYDALNVDPVIRKNTEAPLANIINLATQMAIFHKAGYVIGKTGEFAAEKAGASKATQTRIGNAAQSALDFAMNPYGPVFNAFKSGIVTRLDKFKKSGVPITEGIVQDAVAEVSKEVEIPKDEGTMTVPTPNGDIAVHTENKTALESMAKDGERINFKNVGDLGVDANGDPIQARFSWNFQSKDGTIEVADAQTAVDLSHEFGQHKPQSLRDKLTSVLSGALPDYETNKVAVDRMITDLAVGNLDGNATVLEIHAEALRIAGDLAKEASASRSTANRQAENKPVADSIGTLAAGDKTPTISKIVDLANGKDVAKKAEKPKQTEKDVLKARMDKRVEKFRKENGMMAEKDGTGMRYQNEVDAAGNVDTINEAVSTKESIRDMQAQAKSYKAEANSLLYENDPRHRADADRYAEILAGEVETVQTVSEADLLGGLIEKEIKQAEAEIKTYEQPTKGGTDETVAGTPEGTPGEAGAKEIPAPEVASEKTQPTKVASDISRTLVEKGMDELLPDAQARYSPITKREQVERVASLIESDPAKAREMALGNEPVPNDVHPQVLFNAVKNMADASGDVRTLIELAGSPIATARSEAAQTLGASGFNNEKNDAFEYIAEIAKSRKIDKPSLASFIDKIKC